MSPLNGIGAIPQVARVSPGPTPRAQPVKTAPEGPPPAAGRQNTIVEHAVDVSTAARPASFVRPAAAFSPVSAQTTIRQAEMLLQIAAAAASSPALREIAAAAYQMEMDARREIARAELEGLASGRQWFA